jgi:hypothetical protein
MTDAAHTQTEDLPRSAASAHPLSFWAGLLCVLGIGAFYVLMPVANYTDAKDAISYAARIGEGIPYFHPNHLLYEPLVYVFHRITQTVAGPVDPLIVMQWFSTLCALPFLVCTYLLTWRAWRNAALAVLATGAVGFSFGVWVYSVSPDGYLQPLFLALLVLVMMDPQSWHHRDRAPDRLVLAAALLTAVAVLLHQMYVIFALVIGFVLLFRAEFGPVKARIRTFVIYGGVSGGLVALVYLVVHRFAAPETAFLDWARGYARNGLYFDAPPSLLSPVKGGIGAISTMLTMNGLLAFDFIAERLTAAFPQKSLYEELFIARTAIAPVLKLPILLAMIGAVALWAALGWTALRNGLRRLRPADFTDVVLLVAVIVYAVLVIIWEPTNREFWIQTYVFATIWCLRQIPALTRLRAAMTGALVACLFIVNFFAALSPLSDPRTDYWRSYNAEAIARRDEVDLIVTSCTWLCAWYLRYFAGATVMSPAYEDPDQLAAALADAAPGRVLISSLAYAPHRLAFAHSPRSARPEWTAAFVAAFPPPEPLPEGEEQRFYGFENGDVVPLR